MEFRVNYVIVGLFVLILAACVLVTGLWLSAGFQSKSYNTYEILMYEPVSGLNEQAPVKFNGVQVGYIQTIDLNEKNPRQVILFAQIEEGAPITKSTTATLMAQGITGVTYIGLKAKTPNADLLTKLPGQKYPIIPSSPSLLVEVDTAIRELSSNVDEISAAIKRILSDKNIRTFDSILDHTNNVLDNLDQHSQNIGNILKNTDKITQDFPESIKQFNKTLDTIDKLSTEAEYAVQQWSAQIVPSTFNLVAQIGRLVTDLEQMTGELKEQPSLIIRGKTSRRLGPGE